MQTILTIVVELTYVRDIGFYIKHMIDNLPSCIEVFFYNEDDYNIDEQSIKRALANPKIKFLHSSLNEIIDVATGKYIWFVESNYYIGDNSLCNIRDFLKNEDVDIVQFFKIYKIKSGAFGGNDPIYCDIKSLEFAKRFSVDDGVNKRLENYIFCIFNDSITTKIINKNFIKKYNIVFPINSLRFSAWLFLLQVYIHVKNIIVLDYVTLYEEDIANDKYNISYLIKVLDCGVEWLEESNTEIRVNLIANEYLTYLYSKIKNANIYNDDCEKYSKTRKRLFEMFCEDKKRIDVLEKEKDDSLGYEIICDEIFKCVKRIAIVGSSYTFLIYTLLFEDWYDGLVLNVFSMPDNIVANMKKMGIMNISSQPMMPIDFSLVNKLSILARKYSTPVYGNDDSLEAAFFIKDNFVGLEDGLSNYDYEGALKIDNIFTPDGERIIPFGFSNYIKKIYLTGKKDLPNELMNKAEIISLKKLWDKKNNDDKIKLLKLFDVPIKAIQEAITMGKNVLFITGSYSDNIGFNECDKDTEISMYKEALSKYDENNLIIKPHPRSTLNYREVFPKATVLDGKFPIEFLSLMGIKVSRVVTINSSAAYEMFYNVEVDVYRELQEKYKIKKILG